MQRRDIMAYQQDLNAFLIGNLHDVKGAITTDQGEQNVLFRGSIGFRGVPDNRGGLALNLIRLNLLTTGVDTPKGNSGIIGLWLAKPVYGTSFNFHTGILEADFRSILHYPLIDNIKGFRPVESKEDANFPPYTEGMKGELSGKLPGGLQPEKGAVSFEGKLTFTLDDPVLDLIDKIVIYAPIELHWVVCVESVPSEILTVQPIFIGSGRDDPDVTGTAFDTLIRRAYDLWNRCGTVHCIRILVNRPIYINNDVYRVLDDEAEVTRLRSEVNIDDAVEIFVVERFDSALAVDWGGGGTWSSGTESAKIVTCDQQLDVPCPPPCGYGDCGDVNYNHLAHELGHVLNLDHPDGSYGMGPSTPGSVMEGSGFCRDNPDRQSARNCRNASNPLLYWGRSLCAESPDISD
jgi:hypothetical protein